MHLTNYAINKDNPKFVFNKDADNADKGHKRSFTSVLKVNKLINYIVFILSHLNYFIIKKMI